MNVLISGFYGSGNTGDEAILSSIVQTFKKNYSEVNITVLSLYPDKVEENHDVEALYRPNFGPKWFKTEYRKTIQTLRDADFLLIGGGGLLQDAHSHISIVRYLQTAVLAEWIGTPTVYYAVGVGPIDHPLNRFLVRKVRELSSDIIVRDEDSKQRLEDIDVTKDVRVSADPAFAMDAANNQRIENILSKENIPENKELIGVSVRDFGLDHPKIVDIAQFLDELADQNSHIIFIPFGYEAKPSDSETSLRVKEEIDTSESVTLLQNRYQPEELFGLVGELDFIIGIRLHSIIMGSAQKVPVLGISYLPKVKNVLYRIGYDESQMIKELDECTLENLKTAHEHIQREMQAGSTVPSTERINELRRSAQNLPASLDGNSEQQQRNLHLVLTSILFVFSTTVLTVQECVRILTQD